MTERRFEGRRSAQTAFSKGALLKRGMINVASVFNVLHGFPETSVESSRHEALQSLVNNISKSTKPRPVCIIATFLGIKLLTNSNKFILIVTLRHNTTKKIWNTKFVSILILSTARTQHTKASNLRLVLESFEAGEPRLPHLELTLVVWEMCKRRK